MDRSRPCQSLDSCSRCSRATAVSGKGKEIALGSDSHRRCLKSRMPFSGVLLIVISGDRGVSSRSSANHTVPSLEHNNQVRGESLDLLKYIDSNFEGPQLLPDDPAKREFADELISYSDSFNSTIYKSFQADGVPEEVGSAFDHLEGAFSKFDDGPFFLGQFSIVDITYAPFIEGYQYTFLELKKYDITAGRPNLTKWIEELNKIDAYTQTVPDPQLLLDRFKSRLVNK